MLEVASPLINIPTPTNKKTKMKKNLKENKVNCYKHLRRELQIGNLT